MALAVPVRLCRCWTAENGKEPGRSGSEGLSFVPKVADGPRGRKPASLCRCLLPPGNVRRAPLAVHMQLAHNCSLRTSQLLPGPFCPACGSQPPPCFSWGCGSTLSPSSPLLVAFSQLRMVHRWSPCIYCELEVFGACLPPPRLQGMSWSRKCKVLKSHSNISLSGFCS